jgi:hypothetical protein
MLRIIDHKRINMTDTEWNMYQKICESYTQPHRKGEDLFRELFETNEDGIIVLLVPPTKNFTSMEVFLFLLSVMNNQHLRIVHEQVDALCREGKDNMARIVGELNELVDKLKAVEPPSK